MQGRAIDAKGQGKAVGASKKPRRNVPRFNPGTIVVLESLRDPKHLCLWGVEATSKRVSAFTLEDAVNFMCINTRNFIRSTEGVRPGKLSNDDRMRLAIIHTWTSLQSQEAMLLQAREHLKDLESTLIIQKDLTCAESTALKIENKRLRRRLEAAEASIPDRAIDRWVRIDEYMDALGVEYVRGSTETKFLISRVDPNFDFDKLEEVHAEELSKTASLQPAKTVLPEEGVPEDSIDKTDVEDSNDKVKVVGPTK
ncbi:hypothetical protein ACOSQ2_017064 [Xanthoceras sorbifolium]